MNTPLIRDIPSIAKTLKDARNMAAFKRIMPLCRPFLKLLGVDVEKMDDALDKVDDLVRQIEEMSKIPDHFNDMFASRGWISYDLLNLEVAKGIMHGMDLEYDNKMIAAKAWAALFAVRDWALKAEAGLLEAPPEEPQKTWNEIFQQLRENQASKERLAEWEPRDITIGIDIPQTGSPELFVDGTPEKRLAEYLTFWQARNYGYMARCLSAKLAPPAKQAPARIRQIFASKSLKSFEFTSVQDSGAALSIIQTQLMFEEYGEEVKKAFDFRLINENSEGKPEVRGISNSEWKIISWALY